MRTLRAHTVGSAILLRPFRPVSGRELWEIGIGPSAAAEEIVVAPTAWQGCEELQLRVGSDVWRRLTPRGRRDLTRSLVNLLVRALAPTLRCLLGFLDEPNTKRRSGLLTTQQIFLETLPVFPALHETVEIIIRDWVKAQTDLLVRFCRDWNQISNVFEADRKLDRIAGGEFDLSDPHNGARAVSVLEVGKGVRIVYKPRSCSGERLWFAVLHWLGREGFRPLFQLPRLLERRSYSWMECVERRACGRVEEVRRFYWRWGAQAALAQALGLVDLHHENWIAYRDHPVLVDAEAFGRDAWKVRRRRPGKRIGLPPLLRSGLFPLDHVESAGKYRGIAPFDIESSFPSPPKAWPTWAGEIRNPLAYSDEIAAGYIAATEFVLAKRARVDKLALFAERACRRPANRIFVRASPEYYKLLKDSLQAHHIFGAQSRFEPLLAACLPAAPSPRVALKEARALTHCSIPRFTAAALRVRMRPPVALTRACLKESIALLRTRLL